MNKDNNNLGLPLSSFDGRKGNSLNMDAFSNFEKGISAIDFQVDYPSENFHILKAEGVENMKLDILNKAEEADQLIQKGEAEDGAPTKNSIIQEGVELLKSFQTVKVENSDGTFETYFVKSKSTEEAEKLGK